jgi:hypothetical protein
LGDLAPHGEEEQFFLFKHVHIGLCASPLLQNTRARLDQDGFSSLVALKKPSSFIAKRLERDEALAELNIRLLGFPLGTKPRATLLQSFSHPSCRGHHIRSQAERLQDGWENRQPSILVALLSTIIDVPAGRKLRRIPSMGRITAVSGAFLLHECWAQ